MENHVVNRIVDERFAKIAKSEKLITSRDHHKDCMKALLRGLKISSETKNCKTK